MTIRGLAFAAAFALVGCAAKPNYLFIEPRGGGYRVELRETVGVFRTHEVPVPLADCAFFRQPAAGDGDATPPAVEIWRVMALSPDTTVASVTYGVVPPGFTQVTPQGTRPEPLEGGRRYVVECSGEAIGVTEFSVPETVTRPAPPFRRRPDRNEPSADE